MRNLKLIIIPIISLFLTACQLLPEDTQLKSYRVLVQQGNVIEESKVELLKINMSREQVIFLLGEPVLNNIFDKDRWDYVFFRKRDPEKTQLNMVSIFFKEDKIISMKRIIKNDDGLFDVASKSRKNEPEFLEDNEVLALQKNVFDDIELQGMPEKDIQNEEASDNIEDSEEILNANEADKKIETKQNENLFNDNDEKSREAAETTKTEEKISSLKENYEEPVKRKTDYEIVEEIVNNWKNSWEDKDLEKYFSFYVDNYTSQYFEDHILWKEDRKKRIVDKSDIDIEIENLSITFQINDDETATATFQQIYSSEQYSDSVKKEIIFQKDGNNWKITAEKLIDGKY